MSYIKGNVLVDLGYSEIFFEVDKFNKAVYKFNLRDRDTEPLEKLHFLMNESVFFQENNKT